MKLITRSLVALTLLFALNSQSVSAQEPASFMGEVKIFAGNFAPKGWKFCEGQLLSIAENSALFSILGTTYGGDGRTTFGLPDLRGRTAIHPGQGKNLSKHALGQAGGVESIQLKGVDVHTIGHEEHGTEMEILESGEHMEHGHHDPIKSVAIAEKVNTVQPYLSLNYIICVQGNYPERN